MKLLKLLYRIELPLLYDIFFSRNESSLESPKINESLEDVPVISPI